MWAMLLIGFVITSFVTCGVAKSGLNCGRI
jgi:hypothetical protein